MPNQDVRLRNPLDWSAGICYNICDDAKNAQAMRSVIPGRDQQKGHF